MPNFRARRLAALVALPALALGWTLALNAAPAGAVTHTRYVATTGDDGNDPVNDCTDKTAPCKTIQHAVGEAASGDTVSVAAGTYAESVGIGRDVTISGAGAATVVTGNSDDPTFEIEPDQGDISVLLTNLTIAHNHDAPGVLAFGASVTVSDAEVSDNEAGGILGLFSTLVVNDSVVSDTTDTGGGGGPFGFAPGTGVGIELGSASVNHSTVSGNAGSGVADLNISLLSAATRAQVAPAAPVPESAIVVRRSTVSGNQVGGVVNLGGDANVDVSTVSGNAAGGVVNDLGTTAVTDSTVAGTRKISAQLESQQGGLIEASDLPVVGDTQLLPSASRLKAASRSVQRHLAAHPAAARHQLKRLRPAAAPTGALTVSGSIVAKQRSLPDCFASITDSGNNLSSDSANSCKFSAAKDDQTKTDPKLGPLADNGGPTETHVLRKGSPAIDAIASGKAGCSSSATDQRGVARPQPTGGKCDVGAVELAAEPIVISPASLPHGTVGTKYAKTITATGGQYPTYTWSLASGELPDGLSFGSGGVISGTPTKAGTFTFVVSVNDPVLKRYTIVVEAAAGTNGAGEAPIAETGTNVAPLAVGGSAAVLAGFLLLLTAGRLGRAKGRHRPLA